MSTRSYRHMSVEERETLSLGLARGHSLRRMATVLGRAPSTVSRESARNTARGRPYRACTAQAQAAARARQPCRHDMALRLSKALGRSPESWLAMQSKHDLWQAKQHVKLGKVGKVRLTAA